MAARAQAMAASKQMMAIHLEPRETLFLQGSVGYHFYTMLTGQV